MHDSMRALLSRLIDYAGLFPPAKLDMATTISNYARYREGDDAWMLGRLIVPASRLDEFEEAAQTALRQPPSGADPDPRPRHRPPPGRPPRPMSGGEDRREPPGPAPLSPTAR
jgi:hypothetical protein